MLCFHFLKGYKDILDWGFLIEHFLGICIQLSAGIKISLLFFTWKGLFTYVFKEPLVYQINLEFYVSLKFNFFISKNNKVFVMEETTFFHFSILFLLMLLWNITYIRKARNKFVHSLTTNWVEFILWRSCHVLVSWMNFVQFFIMKRIMRK